MKRIILLFLLLFIPKVEALSYTEYSNFSEFTDKEVTPSDLVSVKQEKRYRYYQLNKILGPYSKENSDFSYIDYEDYILGTESELSLEKPDEEDRIINVYDGYRYQRVSPINYLKIENLNNETLDIKELKIYDDNNQIKIYDTREYLTKNYNLFTGSGSIGAGGFIKIEFHENHYLDNLKIEIILNGENIKYSYETGTTNIYTKDYVNYNNVSNYNHSFEFKNSSLVNPRYEYFYDLVKETSNVLQPVSDVVKFYSYQDKIYRNYNLEKVYNDEYTVNPIGNYIYKDESDFKIYYAYRTRSIIEDVQIENINNTIENAYFEKMNIVKVPNTFKNKSDTQNYDKNNILFLIYFIIFLSLSIIILLLSKHYKSNESCAKV